MIELEQWIPDINGKWFWIFQVFAVVLLTAVANFFIKRFILKVSLKLNRTKTRWDNITVEAMTRPLGWILWLIGLSFAADVIYLKTQSPIFTASDMIRDVGVLICIAWFVLAFIRGAEKEFSNYSNNVDAHTAEAISKLLRLTVIITSALVILQTLGFSISGVLAMGGIGGIAIGFAAKDLLANFFGGLIIYLDRPFTIGDWIRSPDRKIEGTVEVIGWRVTMIRNFESQPIYVPNSIFTNIVVENPSRMANRRIYETVGLRYNDLDSMGKIVKEVTAMLMAHEEIDANKTMIVNFNAFSDSSVDFFVYSFTKTTEWVKFHQIKQDVMLKVAQIIEANKAQIAFPTSSLHFENSIVIDQAGN
jgi:MscS family membrane protein